MIDTDYEDYLNEHRFFKHQDNCEGMIKDITNPKFNIANVPVEQRSDCLNQLIDARDNGFVTQDESINIAAVQWYDQCQIAKLK
jgi:hypothetical protein